MDIQKFIDKLLSFPDPTIWCSEEGFKDFLFLCRMDEFIEMMQAEIEERRSSILASYERGESWAMGTTRRRAEEARPIERFGDDYRDDAEQCEWGNYGSG